MKHYLAPLFVFVSLNFFLLIAYLFFPALGEAGENLATSTNETGAFIWGWSWASGAVRFVAFLGFEMGILWATAMAFLKTRGR